MQWNNTFRRLTALAAALMILFSLGSALAQPEEEVEEQGLLSFSARLVRGTFVEKAVKKAASVVFEEDDDMEEQGFLDRIFAKIDSGLNSVGDFFKDVGQGIKGLPEGVKDVVVSGWDKTTEALGKAAGAVADFANDTVSRAKETWAKEGLRSFIPGYNLDKARKTTPTPTPRPR